VCALRAEKIFAVEAVLFRLCSERCSWFCMMFLALFTFTLWCGSAWFVVRFNIVCGVLCYVGTCGLMHVAGLRLWL